ncbi:MAG TPA: glycosyltransferase [Bryobacteraceae bacterium]|jgi:glycosyltransferase involved in cell wall biosynthesis
MKVLQVHNFYQQAGGEDQVYEAECNLLRSHGHDVLRYTARNDAITGMSYISTGIRTVWNRETYRAVSNLLSKEKPDVVHAHNTFPLISPALHYAVAAQRIPLVQTLHNYRLICTGATLYRDGRVCHDCLESFTLWPAVKHACYRNSRRATAAAGSMILIHRMARTWSNRVHTYIALTNFSKEKFVEGGLPADRITIKPNFVPSDPGIGKGHGGYALFAGRLSEEKGVRTLLRAWERLPGIPLKIAGDGPLRPFVEEQAGARRHVEYLRACEHAAVMELLKQARFLVFPSEWYEGLPTTIIEALACGTPVIASALGSMNELIQDGANGRLFTPRDADDLARCAEAMMQGSNEMRSRARACYERSYTAERNYELLMSIYQNASCRA